MTREQELKKYQDKIIKQIKCWTTKEIDELIKRISRECLLSKKYQRQV